MELIVYEKGKKRRFSAPSGANLLSVLQQNHCAVSAPCGGKGTCLKCRVTIDGIGAVLACQTTLDEAFLNRAGCEKTGSLTVRLPDQPKPQITTDGLLPPLIFSPLVAKADVCVPKPSLEDQRPDEQRLSEAAACQVPYRLLNQVSVELAKAHNHPSYCVRTDTRTIQRFVRSESPGPLGLAVDIGTTTIAGYLCDLNRGTLLASGAVMNPQVAYGADVISRVEQAIAGRGPDLQAAVTRAIGDLSKQLIDQAGQEQKLDYRKEDLAHVVLAGNTIMMHLLCGLPPEAMARTPFVPVSVSAQTLEAAELDLPLQSDTICQLLPSISAYIGADITAGLIATQLGCLENDARELTTALLLDIGTNGEMVLFDGHQMLACSAAAGPAFEGANIQCGTGGIEGAIDRVWFENGQMNWTVIGQNENNTNQARPKAVGVCGSGLVSAVAVFLRVGLIDETGRITDEPERLEGSLKKYIQPDGKKAAIVLAGEDKSLTGKPIVITQKDIRELQNAKAAIAAGIKVLLEKASLEASKIDTLYLAGGFGFHLDIADARTIGLLPDPLGKTVKMAGNTAGMGALACLLQQEQLHRAIKAVRTVKTIELSAEKRFTELFIDAMVF